MRASWDQQAGRVEPKSESGKRDVPVIGRLRELLTVQRMSAKWETGLVFGRAADQPFNSSTINNRAVRAWKLARSKQALRQVPEAARMKPIGLHEARHTFASYLIAAGLDLKTISTYMGHASVSFTIDRYGHLLPDSHADQVARLDAFFERSDTAARLAQLDQS